MDAVIRAGIAEVAVAVGAIVMVVGDVPEMPLSPILRPGRGTR